MNWVDFGIYFVVVLILVLILVFVFIIPRIQHKSHCSNCDKSKKIKRAFKKV